MLSKTLVFFSLALLITDLSFADPRPPPLLKDMGYSEVINLWGPPIEKIEKETKREDIWIYKTNKVFFQEGKVVAWADLIPSIASIQEKPKTEVITNSHDNQNPVAVEEILTEIMKNVPSDDSPSSNTPSGSNTTANALPGVGIPPMPPAIPIE